MTSESLTPSVPAKLSSEWISRWRWTAWLTIPAWVVLGMMFAKGVGHFQAPLFSASATLVPVERSLNLPPPVLGRDDLKHHYPELIAGVVTAQKLSERWHASPEMASERLWKAVSFQGTADGAVHLTVTDRDSAVAAVLANELAVRVATLSIDRGAESTLFQGTVTLQINRELLDWRIFNRDGQPSGTEFVPENFIETQRAILASRKTLYEAVDSLKLNERWECDRTAALAKLSERLTVLPVAGTDLVRIAYVDEDATRARDVANAVATAYRRRRQHVEESRSGAALDTLKKQLNEQSDRVEEARLRMLDLAERYRIIDLAAMNDRPSVTGDPVTGAGEILLASMKDTYEAEAAIAQIKMQIETWQSMSDEELLTSASLLDFPNDVVRQLWPEYQKALLEEKKLLQSELGETDPSVVEAQNQLRRTKNALLEQVKNVRNALSRKLEIASEALSLSKRLEEGKKDGAMDERRKVAEYSEASKAYVLQRNMLANMQAKYATESVDLTMPKTPITIHEEAEIATAPLGASASPAFRVQAWAQANDTFLPRSPVAALGWGSAGGLLVGLLLAVPLMRVFERVYVGKVFS